MRIYSVYRHPQKEAEDAVFVKEGFCWPGLLIPLFWMLYRRLWLAAGIFFLLSMAAAGLGNSGLIGEDFVGLALFLVQLWIGLEGNELRAKKLRARGYELADVVAADDVGEAEIRYFTSLPVRAQPWGAAT